MNTYETNLEKYADLTVKAGVNIQKGQTLFISTSISTAPFVRLVTKKAYEAGAKHVYVDFADEEITRIRYDHAPDDSFLEFPSWIAKGREELAANGAAFLNVYAPNPELLKGVDPDRIANWQKTAGQALKKFREYTMSDKVSWSIVSVPTDAWVAKVYPGEDVKMATEKMWDAIFSITRADLADPATAWIEHSGSLMDKADYLNKKQYKKLHYKGPGTDLAIELVKNHIWVGGGAITEGGTQFLPNIPTEEVFTMPHKDGLNGVVSSTLPLHYGGNLIENFTLTFKNGKVVDFTAEAGYETLKRLLDSDEGARSLGEVALVPHSSPISQSGLIFYNTLYDENASCHLALGNAYPTNIKGGTSMSKEELEAAGVNTSIVHEDFMIGSSQLDIDGELEDGTREPIFRNGEWAI
ncbi:aminopeptidase [Bacillus sp. HMF5848]|uniref:aminopeptidase n=1 Tax=Bacillus sp. HMF5848 TaxID=2495421 RepID=UPI000F7B6829|nr:aminopeptidase [Bacillus sp. HMF5848]RSK26746.1 aminopeptidase [Bacillus sp. HMF5848]